MTVYNEFDSVWAPPNTVVDDQGAEHDTVQAAVDNTDSMVLIGPGQFDEAVTIPSTNDGIVVRGVGQSTLINGGQDTAIDCDAANAEIRDLAVRTDTVAPGDNYGVNTSGSDTEIQSVTVENADSNGIRVIGFATRILNCNVEVTGGDGINVRNARCEVSDCYIGDTNNDIGDEGILAVGGDISVSNNIIYEPTNTGIRGNGDGQNISNNIIIGPNQDAIVLQADSQTVADNTYRNVGGKRVDTSASTNPMVSEDFTREFTYSPGMTEWSDGLATEEVDRIALQGNERLVVEQIEFRQKGGGSSTSASVDVYDSTAAAAIGSANLGSTTENPGLSGAANTVLVRVSNSTGGTINAAPRVSGYILES